jgi:hypothetical protein
MGLSELSGGRRAGANANQRKADPMRALDLTWAPTALILALAAATPVRAEINQQCYTAWLQAVSVQAIGAKCRLMTPAIGQKLKASEASMRACAIANATPAEKAEVDGTHSPKSRGWVANSIKDMPCNAQAKQFFDSQVGLIK